jgi:hypothetical protein
VSFAFPIGVTGAVFRLIVGQTEDQADVIGIVGTQVRLVPGDVLPFRESARCSEPGTSTPPQADLGAAREVGSRVRGGILPEQRLGLPEEHPALHHIR